MNNLPAFMKAKANILAKAGHKGYVNEAILEDLASWKYYKKVQSSILKELKEPSDYNMDLKICPYCLKYYYKGCKGCFYAEQKGCCLESGSWYALHTTLWPFIEYHTEELIKILERS